MDWFNWKRQDWELMDGKSACLMQQTRPQTALCICGNCLWVLFWTDYKESFVDLVDPHGMDHHQMQI